VTDPVDQSWRENAPWASWSGRVHNIAGRLFAPRDVDELQAAVRWAADQGVKVRAVGGGHSWSRLTAIEDGHALISLHNLRGLIGADLAACRARFFGGTHLYDVNEALAGVGLGLSNLGSIDKQTIAGVVSTATHGTGVGFGNLSTAVRSLVLVTADGARLRCSEEENADLFAAARCGLGSLGVIAEVTMQCEPQFNLRGVEEKRPIDDALAALPDLIARHEHVKLWWLPHTDTGIVFIQERTDAPARPQPVRGWLRNKLLKNHVFRAGMATATSLGVVPSFNRVLAAASPARTEVVERSDKVFTFPVDTKHEEMEYAIPSEAAVEAMQRVRDIVATLDTPVGFIVELRFVRGDDIWLSPAYGRDTAYIGALQHHALPFDDYFERFAAMMADYEGRPHWGKRHRLTADGLRQLYPRWDDFLAVRKRLDPGGLFLNNALALLFGEG